MADFDSILNTIVPWVVFVVGIYLLYKPLKRPLSPLFRGIGNFFRAIKRKITGEDKEEMFFEGISTIEYE